MESNSNFFQFFYEKWNVVLNLNEGNRWDEAALFIGCKHLRPSAPYSLASRFSAQALLPPLPLNP